MVCCIAELDSQAFKRGVCTECIRYIVLGGNYDYLIS